MIFRNLVIVAFAFWNLLSASELPKATFMVKVVDEFSQPIYGANVHIGYQSFDLTTKRLKHSSFGDFTDVNGELRVEVFSHKRITFGVDKSGYYKGYGEPLIFDKVGDGNHWHPLNPTLEIVLIKKGNAIPLYHMKIRTKAPVLDEYIGFDLIKGDWVYDSFGGTERHLEFKFSKTVESYKNFTSEMEVRFFAEGDGLLLSNEKLNRNSELGFAKEAPVTGYVNGINNLCFRDENHQSPSFDRNRLYYLKSSGMYGVVVGEIMFYAINSVTVDLEFQYYLNPTGTRNLEFNGNNLGVKR